MWEDWFPRSVRGDRRPSSPFTGKRQTSLLWSSNKHLEIKKQTLKGPNSFLGLAMGLGYWIRFRVGVRYFSGIKVCYTFGDLSTSSLYREGREGVESCITRGSLCRATETNSGQLIRKGILLEVYEAQNDRRGRQIQNRQAQTSPEDFKSRNY